MRNLHLILLVAVANFTGVVYSQPCDCVNTILWGNITLPSQNGVTATTGGIWSGDVITLNAAAEGRTYRISSSVSTDNLKIYTDNPATNLVGCDASPFTFSSPITGTLYLHVISVQGCGADALTRTISAECMDCDPAGPPVNNLCAAATELDASHQNACGTQVFGSTQLATNSGETAPSCAASGLAGGDVWFKFTAQGENYQLGFSNIMGFNGSTGNMQHALYSGSCGSLVQLQCGGLRWYGLEVGETYYLRVWTGSSNASQYASFNLCIFYFDEPPHNLCGDAAVLTPATGMDCDQQQNLSTRFASNSGETGPSCLFNGLVGGDVWVRFTATTVKHMLLFSNLQHFEQGGVSTNMYMALYTDTCGSLIELDCGNAIFNTNRIFSGLTPGQEYFVRIWTSNVSTSQYTIFDVCLVTPPGPPANNFCSDATLLAVSDMLSCEQPTPGSTSSATNSAATTPSCVATGLVSGDVWYQFTASSDKHRVQLTDVNHFGGISWVVTALYSGSCGQLTELACINQSSNVRDFEGLTPGTTYYLRIWTESNLPDHFITFNICVGTFPPPPPNDECTDAIPVGVPSSTQGYNLFANNNVIGFECSGGLGVNNTAYSGVWYSITGNGGVINVSTCNSADFPTRLAVFSGSCASLVCVAGNNVGEGCSGGTSELSFNSVAGTLYYIIVSSTSSISNRGTFTLNITSDQQDDCPPGPVVYVQSGSNGSGTSWNDALGSLQDALDIACECPQISQIWVAQGSYFPDQGLSVINNDREATFQLCNGVALYGGFNGTESSVSQRDWINNATILSGDINQSMGLDDNSFTVINGSETNNTAVLDGFIITMGNANLQSGFAGAPARSGGGMYNENGSPSISNCWFVGNNANANGGGMYNSGSSPVIKTTVFEDNIAGTNGGGIFNGSESSPEIILCIFTGNISGNDGGAIRNSTGSSPQVINSKFSNNSTNFRGGAIHQLGSELVVVNSTFSHNNAQQGGAIASTSGASATITNSIIWDNTANGSTSTSDASIYNIAFVSISYSLIANSGGSTAWNNSIGEDGGHNIDSDPQFIDPENGNFQLDACSPAIDAGTPDTSGLGLPDADLAGNSRIVNEIVDIGAYEYDGPQCNGEVLLGDANCDSEVNVLDVVTIIDFLLENNPTPFCFENADYDEDGEVTVLDAVAVIGELLSGE